MTPGVWVCRTCGARFEEELSVVETLRKTTPANGDNPNWGWRLFPDADKTHLIAAQHVADNGAGRVEIEERAYYLLCGVADRFVEAPDETQTKFTKDELLGQIATALRRTLDQEKADLVVHALEQIFRGVAVKAEPGTKPKGEDLTPEERQALSEALFKFLREQSHPNWKRGVRD